MAIELAPHGIACCTVYPGSVGTEFIKEWAEARGSNVDDCSCPQEYPGSKSTEHAPRPAPLRR